MKHEIRSIYLDMMGRNVTLYKDQYGIIWAENYEIHDKCSPNFQEFLRSIVTKFRHK